MAAHVLLFDDNPSWCRSMRSALLTHGHSVAASPDLDSARRSASARPPDVLVVNMDLGLPAVDAIRVVRRASPHACVLVLSSLESPERLAIRHNADAGGDKKESLLELAEAIGKLHKSNAKRDSKRPNLHALTRLVAIWLGRRSGTLSCPAGTALMADGAPLDDSSRKLISKLLFDTSEVDFTPGKARQHPDPDRFGQQLFQAAKAGADVRFVERQSNRVLQAMPGTPRIQALNLHRDTSRLLTDGMGRGLAHTVTDFRLDEESVGIELDALMRLGLLGLSNRRHMPKAPGSPATPRRAAPTPRPPRPTSRRSATARGQAPTHAAESPGLNALMVLKRLRKELSRLKEADPWTVLGIAPTQDPELIQQAAQRMRERYTSLIQDPELSEEIHRLAGEILRKVEHAAAHADVSDAREDLPRDQRLFKEAMRLFERSEFSVASRLLRGAHRMQVYDPKYQAWLGRSLGKEAQSLPKAARTSVRTEASELLQLACQLSDEPVWELWLVDLLLELGDLERSGKLLKRVERAVGDIEGLKQAQARHQALLAKASPEPDVKPSV